MTVMPPTLDSKFWFWMRVCSAEGQRVVLCWSVVGEGSAHLDHIKRLRDGNRRDLCRVEGQKVVSGSRNVITHRTSDGSDKVLEPCSRAVVLEAKDVLLGEGRSSEELSRRLVQALQSSSSALDLRRRIQERYEQQSTRLHGTIRSPRHG